MTERRVKRSSDRSEALQFLVETVADRSKARALVLVDDAGSIVAGVGYPKELPGLARVASDVARGRASFADIASAHPDADVTARSVAMDTGRYYLAAIGDRVCGVGDAVRAVRRICAAAPR
jgi:hypothetical protein